jgi:hypothetical protein
MAITREVARSAEAQVRSMNAEADRLEAQARVARETAAVTAKKTESVVREWEGIESGAKLHASDELRQLRKRVEGLIGAKQDPARPGIEARMMARAVLRDPAPDLLKEPARLSVLDPRYAALAGAQDTVQRFAGRNAELRDEGINAGVDDLEVLCHRAVLARLRWLAGED